MFESIPGHDRIKKYLSRMIEKGEVPHAFLFCGPADSPKALAADIFAKLIVGTASECHPDIHHYYPEGKIGLHTIQSMREFSAEVYLAPFQAKRKVFILHEVHRMQPYSANALLKTFEEPADDTVIILISDAMTQLLPTILSRCQTVRFQSVETMTSASNPLVESLLNFLSSDTHQSYPQIQQFSKAASENIDAQMKEITTEQTDKLLAAFSDKPSAALMEKIEKEVEGEVAMRKNGEARALFTAIFSWFRDLELLQVQGNAKLLINQGYQTQLKKSLEERLYIPLEKVEVALSEAIISMERSTSMAICIETLLLKLSTYSAT